MKAARRAAPTRAIGDPSLPETAVKTKVWLERDGRFVVGDGGLRLLLAILEHGSLLAAARAIGWSYRHAWGYLHRAEAALGTPLTRPRPGKGAARGTVVTDTGRAVIDTLAAIRNRIDDAVGPTGPTAADVAARGKGAVRMPEPRGTPSRRARYRDGDWRLRD